MTTPAARADRHVDLMQQADAVAQRAALNWPWPDASREVIRTIAREVAREVAQPLADRIVTLESQCCAESSDHPESPTQPG